MKIERLGVDRRGLRTEAYDSGVHDAGALRDNPDKAESALIHGRKLAAIAELSGTRWR